MQTLDADLLKDLWYDYDAREVALRRVIGERLAARPAPTNDDYVIATYFFASAVCGWTTPWRRSATTRQPA
jgi:hypothetical protein